MISRYSSRRQDLPEILRSNLPGATSYDRIAGYFSSSVLEVAGEAIETMAPGAVVRIVCNSQLQPLDVITARAAKQAMSREWRDSMPAETSDAMRTRLERLYDLLTSGRMRVKVLPDELFGLVHGKAGVITRGDGSRISFLGSTNESKSGWRLNYELIWADDGDDAVNWVQDEFDALWGAPEAYDLAEAVVQEIGRQRRCRIVATIGEWVDEEAANPASSAIELPIYRRENGLWAHQKYFVQLAFRAHREGGARYVLADQVGLGKTLQLGLAARLMALVGEGPILVLAPKPLLEQWQDEMWDLLEFPCARWTGRQWVDEQGIAYPETGIDGLKTCPRRLGIVSSGLVIYSDEAAAALLSQDYECVIIDEAHRARRKNTGVARFREKAIPNNLLAFLREVSPRSKSVLLATATPVQLDAIEAFDLLEALALGAADVLGTEYSKWRTQPREGLALVQGRQSPPSDLAGRWEWMRNPLPPAHEGLDFYLIREAIDCSDAAYALPEDLGTLSGPEHQRVDRVSKLFFLHHNPYIRLMVRRTREYLENTLDPQTNEPYLRPVRVRLFGETTAEAVELPTYLRDAYEAAEQFCAILARRQNLGSRLMETILLRRTGSSIEAGRLTAEKLLQSAADVVGEDEEDETAPVGQHKSAIYPLTSEEEEQLRRFLALLESANDDPKAREVERIVLSGLDEAGPWIERGCIVFSQYYDSVWWLANRLSARLPDERVGIYAGATRSGILHDGRFVRVSRSEIKQQVMLGEIRLLIGTDAASEGLNLQRLGTLINLDLPWNPTRLEQRKGRIQRIGQARDEVLVYNMRYRGSVEDRVHDLLSQRLQSIRDLFGQLPDTLEDAWVYAALGEIEKAKQIIDEVPPQHPFDVRYNQVESVDWESCAAVLDGEAQLEVLMKSWRG